MKVRFVKNYPSNNTLMNFRTLGEWRIQLIIKMKFISLKYGGKSQHMHFKCDNRESRLVLTEMQLSRSFLIRFCISIKQVWKNP